MRLPRTGAFLDTLRLSSGLTLFLFALTHFLNHALGLWSLDVMETVQGWRLAVTHSYIGTGVLALALFTHLSLALWRIARLKTWRLPRASAWLLVTGGLISVVIMPHLYQAGFGARVADRTLTYPAALTVIWPGSIRLQTSLLALVWLHGCIGLHQWLKGEPWWRRHSHALVALAALVPAAAVAGVVTAGREVARLRTLQTFPTPYPEAERLEWVARAGDASRISVALLALALGVAIASWLYAHRRRRLPISYEPGPKVYSAPGPTLLEISRANRVPHLSVCGGKARCSTCRVRILEGQDDLDAPSEAERTLLRRIGADGDVRLACQIRPTQPLTISRLLSPESAGPAFGGGLEAAGVDRVVAVLFVDIRGFTKLSEAKLAFDVVYILNAFFTEAGKAVEACGGRVDKYIGDGMMALFEHAEGLPSAARNALAAVVAIDASLRNVNQRLAGEIDAPLAVAMGLHGGRLVSGRIGYGEAAHPTVIGPVVNVASRLETLAKARGVELAMSRACAEAAGLDVDGLTIEAADIRGLGAAFSVVLVPLAAELGAIRSKAATDA